MKHGYTAWSGERLKFIPPQQLADSNLKIKRSILSKKKFDSLENEPNNC